MRPYWAGNEKLLTSAFSHRIPFCSRGVGREGEGKWYGLLWHNKVISGFRCASACCEGTITGWAHMCKTSQGLLRHYTLGNELLYVITPRYKTAEWEKLTHVDTSCIEMQGRDFHEKYNVMKGLNFRSKPCGVASRSGGSTNWAAPQAEVQKLRDLWGPWQSRSWEMSLWMRRKLCLYILRTQCDLILPSEIHVSRSGEFCILSAHMTM